MVTVLTSVIFYIVPQGRIAYWSDWHLWGLSKEQWGNIHINTGILFVLALILHIYYNWNLIFKYLKDRTKKVKVFTGDFNVALVLTVVCILGTNFMIPPFSLILNISQNIKDAAAIKYGEPPFGHAEEAPFDSLVKKTGLDFKQSVAKLKEKRIELDAPNQIFLDIAQKYNMTPQQVYNIIKIKPSPGDTSELPEVPPPGTGTRSLSQLCQGFTLDCDTITKGLVQKGMKVDSEISLKALANGNELTSIELYDFIKEIVKTTGPSLTQRASANVPLPDFPEPGTGSVSIEQLCEKYGLNTEKIMNQLESSGLKVTANKSIKSIAEQNGQTPLQIYEAIKKVASN